jgi:hypothetical protein
MKGEDSEYLKKKTVLHYKSEKKTKEKSNRVHKNLW